MRKKAKWNAIAAGGSQKTGMKGLSAGITMAVKKEVRALVPNCDHEGATGPPRSIITVLKGDAEIVPMHVYGHVGLGGKGANFEILLEIAAATDGGRRTVVAMGE